MSIVARQDAYVKACVVENGVVKFKPNASIFQPENYATFYNFVSFHQPFTQQGGDSTYKKNTDIKFDNLLQQ